MGCSASKSNTLLSKHDYHPEETQSCYASSSMESSTLSSSSPVPRALSLQTPLVHHPPSKKGDSHHLVSLTSTTYGSLLLTEPVNGKLDQAILSPPQPKSTRDAQKGQALEDPDPPGESLSPDSVINTWELMDGLDDEDDEDEDMGFQIVEPLKPKPSPSAFYVEIPSKPTVSKKLHGSFDSVRFEEIDVGVPVSSSKPLWKHLSEESLLSKMDPNVVSSYMRALSSRQLGFNNKEAKPSTRSVDSSPVIIPSLPTKKESTFHGKENRVVLYFTSLRGIRKTYEDCYEVRMIFRGFRVPVDERDISMDSAYRKELQTLLKGKPMVLPQVFIRGDHIGGVEEIRQLNEIGELAKLLQGFPIKDPTLVCESCGDARFVPCPNCSGSRKVFNENEEQLRRCPDCNENGLIRCPGCCPS